MHHQALFLTLYRVPFVLKYGLPEPEDPRSDYQAAKAARPWTVGQSVPWYDIYLQAFQIILLSDRSDEMRQACRRLLRSNAA